MGKKWFYKQGIYSKKHFGTKDMPHLFLGVKNIEKVIEKEI